MWRLGQGNRCRGYSPVHTGRWLGWRERGRVAVTAAEGAVLCTLGGERGAETVLGTEQPRRGCGFVHPRRGWAEKRRQEAPGRGKWDRRRSVAAVGMVNGDRKRFNFPHRPSSTASSAASQPQALSPRLLWQADALAAVTAAARRRPVMQRAHQAPPAQKARQHRPLQALRQAPRAQRTPLPHPQHHRTAHPCAPALT